MRLFIVVPICCLALVVSRPYPAVSPNPDTETKQKGLVADGMVGAWRLVSVETIRPNGEVIYPFYGKHPEGLLIYDRNGWMSVQIVSDPKPTVPATGSREGFLAAPPAEKVAAIEGYYAYFGTWTVDSSGSTVTHHIEQSLYPGAGCTHKCTAKVLKQGRTEWWIQIKTKVGTTGWTKDASFDGMDALGGTGESALLLVLLPVIR